MTIERRSSALEIRANGRRLQGYAATFNTPAQIGDFVENISPGAFANSLSRDVVALMDHDVSRVLARTRSKTLRLSENSRGLFFDLDLPATSYGRDVLELCERGDLGGCSFGFKVPQGGDKWEGKTRTLTNVELHEISIVSAWPAYPQTSVVARAQASLLPLRLALARRYLETVK